MTAAATTTRGRVAGSSAFVVRIERVSRAVAPHRAEQALRLARRAERGAEIHQRLVEVEHVAVRQHRPRHVPERPLHRVRLRIAAADEDAKEHPRDVGVEDRGALAEREAQDGAGRVLADALERRAASSRPTAARRRSARPTRARSRAAAAAGCCSRAAARSRRRRASGAAASASSVGYLSSHSWYFGSTRSTCVCCSITSDTRMWYGSRRLPPGQVASVSPVPLEQPPAEPLSCARRNWRPSSPSPYNRQPGENLHQDRRQRRNRPLRRHARVEVGSARGGLRRRRRAERLAGTRTRVARPDDASSSRCSSSIQRDLFALGARLADPAHRIAERVDEGGGRPATTSRGSSSGSMRSKRSCRRCDGSSSPADRRAARRCMSRAPSAAAPSGRWWRWPRRQGRTHSSRSC